VPDIAVQRILVRQGVTADLGSLLIADLRRAVEHFDRHPVHVSMTEAEAGGFNHG
jgi:glutamate decarboxylase